MPAEQSRVGRALSKGKSGHWRTVEPVNRIPDVGNGETRGTRVKILLRGSSDSGRLI